MTPLKALCYLLFTGANYAIYLFLLITAFRSATRFPMKKTLAILSVSFVIGSVLEVLAFEVDSPFYAYVIPAKIFMTLVDGGTALLLIRKQPVQIFFGFFMLMTIQNNVIAAGELLTELAPLPILVADFPNLNYLVYTLAMLLLFLPVLYYLFCKLLRRVMELGMDVKQWSVLMLLPFLYFIYGFTSEHGGATLHPATWGNFCNLTLLNACALVAYSSIIKMITYSYDKYEVTGRAEAAANQLVMEQARYETLAKHIGETDRLVHDMRHHMLSFQDFSQRGDLQGLRRYLDGIVETYQTEEMPTICARPTVDVILRHNLALALEADIEVEHQVEIPTEFNRSDLDLCIVFGNLMENALEACLRQTEGERFIRVNTDCIGGKMLAIRVENSFAGELVWRGGICESAKRKGSGLGLASVKSVAEQNGGSCCFTAKDSIFTAEVLLNT
ncbi:MAG: ATP-binding protein [Oscillospiraceae bacterium]